MNTLADSMLEFIVGGFQAESDHWASSEAKNSCIEKCIPILEIFFPPSGRTAQFDRWMASCMEMSKLDLAFDNYSENYG